jgi:hypothetical protein
MSLTSKFDEINQHEADPYDWVDGDGPGVHKKWVEDEPLKDLFSSAIPYAFKEDEILEEMWEYIDGTYDAHYSQSKYQSTQIIEDMGHGMGFALGNVVKYCQRYGKKQGYNRADLMKVIHYGIIALAMHDREHEDKLPDSDDDLTEY